MKNLTIKRKEVPFIVAGLAQVKGMKNFMKAITLGRDSRVLKGIQDESEIAVKHCKPENYDALADELRELKQKKAKEFKINDGEVIDDRTIGEHVLLTWKKAKEWVVANKEYNEAVEAILNETISVEVHSELKEEDLPKSVEDITVAEVLSYFMKE